MNKTKIIKIALVLFYGIFNLNSGVLAQPQYQPWGNIKGIRIDGELMQFETSLRAIDKDWLGYVSTEKYNWEGKQTFEVEDKKRTIAHALAGMPLNFEVELSETAKGNVDVVYNTNATEAIDVAGLFFCFELPGADFVNASVTIENAGSKVNESTLKESLADMQAVYAKAKGNKVTIKTANRSYEIISDKAVEIIIKQNFIAQPAYLNDPYPRQKFVNSDTLQKIANYQIYFTVAAGKIKKGQKNNAVFNIKTSGTIDTQNVVMQLNASNPGRKFDGISGNYRWQFPDRDQVVIDYLLDSLRVTWGRVAFFWDEWQPNEVMDAIANAKAGNLSPRFYKQLELTRDLYKRNIPIIVSVWTPPTWAIDPDRKPGKGVYLNMKKMNEMNQSIASYLTFLKQEYGVEVQLFSFNEPDYGVEVYQKADDHYIQTKMIGEYLAKNGFVTKMMLADTGQGSEKSNRIMKLIEDDSTAHRYSGAIALHTYHGCTDTDLMAWANSGKKMNLPVMVTEAGTNSAAHRYPLVFLEPNFQLEEIDLYIRICNIVQPITIMEWQLTSDYSVLTGNGMYGDTGALRPTQRYWNLKQLGSTPYGSFALPITCSKPNISVAAYGDIANHTYSLHMVNNGATRQVTINGIPTSVTEMQIYVTDYTRGMQKGKAVKVENGSATFTLEALTYTTLMN